MSAKVTIWAWRQTDRFGPKEGPLLLTLLAIADTSRDNGKVWASHGYIAKKAHQSPRTVRGNIEALEARGFLRTEPTAGRPDVIWLQLTATTLFEGGPETDEPGALEKGPRRPRQEMPTSGSAAGAEGVGAEVQQTSASPAYKPRLEPRTITEAIASARGTRLAAGWEPDLIAATMVGLSHDDALAEAEVFRDYWSAAPGQKGVKADWPATWRNWCRRKAREGNRNGRGSPATRIDYADERHARGVERVLAGIAEASGGGRRQRWRL